MSCEDTIYALSSGGGVAAVAVIRLSGPAAGWALTSLTGGRLPPARTFVVRRLINPSSGETLDKSVVVWTPGPGSFSGQDSAELHVHGSRAVIAELLQVLGGLKGLRLAEPGEFTLRAWRNGKLDLVEAEGLGDLLEAQTAAQRRQAIHQMCGSASSVFDSWREQLVLIRADIEASVDFPDEEDASVVSPSRIDAALAMLRAEMQQAVEESRLAESIRTGVKVVLAGLPNTGKSSLLNALARRDVAIVSPIPGTTRDVIEVALNVGGIPVLLMDTAGIRTATDEPIEKEGVKRAWNEVRQADVLVWVGAPDVPGSMAIPEDVEPDLVVAGKSDLQPEGMMFPRNDCAITVGVALSAQTGAGVSGFLERIGELVSKRFAVVEAPTVVTARQRDAVRDSIRFLNNCLDRGITAPELKAEEVRRAADAIGRITGRTDVEEWLAAIFSRFCIGK